MTVCTFREEEEDESSGEEAVITEEDLVEDACITEYHTGSYSPRLMAPGDIDDIEAVIYDPIDDMKKLALARIQVKSTGRVRVSVTYELISEYV